MKAHLIHLGCRLNQYENNILAAILQEKGAEITRNINDADVIILNTCTVTNRADSKNLSLIRKTHNLNRKAVIVVTGCFATTDREKIQNLPGVTKVLENKVKLKIPEILLDNKSSDRILEDFKINGEEGSFRNFETEYSLTSRAYLKIQDGCDQKCNYCKIPMARGRGVSRNFNDIIKEADHYISNGFHEIIITGINIGDYRANSGESFVELIANLLERPGKFILRLSSVEPIHLKAWGKKKMMGREYDGIFRMSYLVNPEGKIAKIYKKVKPTEHADEVLADLKELQ